MAAGARGSSGVGDPSHGYIIRERFVVFNVDRTRERARLFNPGTGERHDSLGAARNIARQEIQKLENRFAEGGSCNTIG
jgi:hypothetical protein